MKRSESVPLKEVLTKYIKVIGGEQKIRQIRLTKNWEQLMGKNINEQTQSIYFKNNIIYLKIRSSVVKHELFMMKTEIIKHLVQNIDKIEIKDIVFL
jgi:phosphopantetheine adenylyltransferase